MDEDILRGLKQRDLKAIKMLYESLFTPLRFLAERITKNESEAEDIAQNSLIKLWERGASDFHSLDHLTAYVRKMVEYAALDYLKRQKSIKNYQRYLSNTNIESEEFIVDQSRYEVEMTKAIYREIDKLSTQTKEVFRLVYLKRIPRNEVAQKLGISINTVYVHCSKAKNELRQLISEKELFVLFLLFSLCGDYFFLKNIKVFHPFSY